MYTHGWGCGYVVTCSYAAAIHERIHFREKRSGPRTTRLGEVRHASATAPIAAPPSNRLDTRAQETILSEYRSRVWSQRAVLGLAGSARLWRVGVAGVIECSEEVEDEKLPEAAMGACSEAAEAEERLRVAPGVALLPPAVVSARRATPAHCGCDRRRSDAVFGGGVSRGTESRRSL